MIYTNNESERLAYISGDTSSADTFFKADQMDGMEDEGFILESELDDRIDTAIENKQPDYEFYKAFFEECFERLNQHYPCPSVTSDYDCSVIFDAISKGDTE